MIEKSIPPAHSYHTTFQPLIFKPSGHNQSNLKPFFHPTKQKIVQNLKFFNEDGPFKDKQKTFNTLHTVQHSPSQSPRLKTMKGNMPKLS